MEIKNKNLADIGVFGGSGFYKFLDNIKEITLETPYGAPSDSIMIGEIAGKRVAFIPRHGRNHSILPHNINYKANVWAMKTLGVSTVICPCAAGSLQKHVNPGDFVICDQFVNKTWNRPDTFFEGPIATHVSPADPYCPELREIAIQSAEELGIPVHKTGTILVIQGPRFSTKAESKYYTAQGWEVINMTQYPEAYLVKELDMCPVNISLITDYDAGLVGDVLPVSHSEVIKVFNENNEKLKNLLFAMIKKIADRKEVCNCKNTLINSRI
ncbi:MAG: S-methyl-5'-thioadenosine phosphorylase [Candidatus Gastranaerophilales bacterium]|nr:S-methyl-5'-thioadenosine phosphorylase [Candidatus Gastranaerophilales bacterium]